MSAYIELVRRFGAGRVADALLAKWRADPDGDQQWGNLAKAIGLSGLKPIPSRAHAWSTPVLSPTMIHALTASAHGLRDAATAERMGCSVGNVKDLYKFATRRLGAKTTTAAVAQAIRSGQVSGPASRRRRSVRPASVASARACRGSASALPSPPTS